MRMAKIFAIMFALFLAVFCMSGPFAFGGDEHPWDEEGGGDGGDLDGVDPDPEEDEIPDVVGFGAGTSVGQSDGSRTIDFMRYSLFISFIL